MWRQRARGTAKTAPTKDVPQQRDRFQIHSSAATFQHMTEPFSSAKQRSPPDQGTALPFPPLPFQMLSPPAPLHTPHQLPLGIGSRESAGLLMQDVAAAENLSSSGSFSVSVTLLVRALQSLQRNLAMRKTLEFYPDPCRGPGASGIFKIEQNRIKM
jgi:hypothetical protein